MAETTEHAWTCKEARNLGNWYMPVHAVLGAGLHRELQMEKKMFKYKKIFFKVMSFDTTI